MINILKRFYKENKSKGNMEIILSMIVVLFFGTLITLIVIIAYPYKQIKKGDNNSSVITPYPEYRIYPVEEVLNPTDNAPYGGRRTNYYVYLDLNDNKEFDQETEVLEFIGSMDSVYNK